MALRLIIAQLQGKAARVLLQAYRVAVSGNITTLSDFIDMQLLIANSIVTTYTAGCGLAWVK